MPLLFHSSYPPLPFLFPSSPPLLFLLLFLVLFLAPQTDKLAWPKRLVNLPLLEPLSTGCSTCAAAPGCCCCSRLLLLLLLLIQLFLSLVSAFLFWHTSWHISNIAYSLPRRMFPTELIISNANQRRASACTMPSILCILQPTVCVCVCVCVFFWFIHRALSFVRTLVFYLSQWRDLVRAGVFAT